MKHMLIMRATDQAMAEAANRDFEEILNEMGACNESMIDAGVLVAGEGLAEPEEGTVVDFSTDSPQVTDGPYGDTEKLFNGFWIIQTSSWEEAIEWARRAPLGPGTKLEVRRVQEVEDFADYADNEYLQKEAEWRQRLGTG